MAKIFVSHTGADGDWADWIGFALEELGHEAAVDRWEVSGGGDIAAWMDEKMQWADHCLMVCSAAYFSGKIYSDWERRSALWESKTKSVNFALPVFVEKCDAPRLMQSLSRCEIFGVTEHVARQALENFLTPAQKPTNRPAFPPLVRAKAAPPPFPPEKPVAVSNIPLRVPEHFIGRDAAMRQIAETLTRKPGAIVAAHGLRGVGKSTLAAAFAERHRRGYRVTWWLRAQTAETLRADLAGLAVGLGLCDAQAKEAEAVAAALDALRADGAGVLLIYDNAIDAKGLRDFLPRGGEAKIVITSNAPDWRGIAEPIPIEVWDKARGAEFLLARCGGGAREAAEALSEALGGLPLALEQAAAYCQSCGFGFRDYLERLEATPAQLLDTEPALFYERTVAETFALAIEAAAQRHPAAEPLIVHAALLAPEPIPDFFFVEGREKFGEPLAELLAGEGFDTVVAALRAFALIDVERITDERDAAVETRCLRLHRLVRIVAAARAAAVEATQRRKVQLTAMAAVFPGDGFDNHEVWPRARRLEALALELVGEEAEFDGVEAAVSVLLNNVALYRQGAIADYESARRLSQRSLALSEAHFGLESVETAARLSNLAVILENLGGAENLRTAAEHLRRALNIDEAAFGPEHPSVAVCLSNLATVYKSRGGADNLWIAAVHLNRALAINEKTLGLEHPSVANALSNLATVLHDLGGTKNLQCAVAHLDRALKICASAFGPDHPKVATTLSNLALIRRDLGGTDNLQISAAHLKRALNIDEAALGREHLNVANRHNNLALVLAARGSPDDIRAARWHFRSALEICRRILGDEHHLTRLVAVNLAAFLAKHGDEPTEPHS